MISALVIDATDIGVDIAAGNVGDRLTLDVRGKTDVHAVTEQIAVSCVASGSAHSKTALRARRDVRRNGRRHIAGCIIVAIQRRAIGIGKLVFVVAECDV